MESIVQQIANLVNQKAKIDRRSHNKQILLLLEKFLEENPDLRFQQALQVMRINEVEQKGATHEGYPTVTLMDKFYEESDKTLKHLRSCLSFMKSEEK